MGAAIEVVTRTQVRLDVDSAELNADLSIPVGAGGLVIFAHGSGSSRHSPRNRAVAELLHHGHLATLLVDLLTAHEDLIDASTAEFRFNIPLLADRLAGAVDWAHENFDTSPLPIGLYGASTGAAAALMAAAARPSLVRAVVSRGGRPDLAEEALDTVNAPTLLIVGGRDGVVIDINLEACARLKGTKELQVVPGATHLFEEPGALDHVSKLARHWFEQHLAPRRVEIG